MTQDENQSHNLTSYRLQSLEESVRELTRVIAENNDTLSKVEQRLAVGTERHTHYDKRLSSLEGDRRWVVLALVGALGSLVWQALATLFKGAPLVLIAIMLQSCIPVTVYPPRDEAGLPIAAPVTPVGSIETPAGPVAIEAVYEVSKETPRSPTVPWGTIAGVLLTVFGGGGGVVAYRAASIARRTRTALKIATTLVDQVSAAETDDDVKSAKMAAMQAQVREGVHDLTQSVRHS